MILSPFGGRVHAPLTLAIETRLRERLGIEAQTIWSDDGIAVRLPEGEGDGDARRLAEIEALLFPAADEVEDLVVEAVGGSALFASRFRENAGRALLLPRRRPGARTPLWQQRQRAADLLQVASRYGSFPILVETYRECLSDVFDLDALREVLGGIERREITVHGVETAKASPFASSLLFDYVAAYMYEGDAPLAERRAGALALDRDLLRELLGQEELRELLDPEALADLELSLQALTEDRQANSVEHLHDLLRRVGDLSDAEVGARVEGGARRRERLAARARGLPARGAAPDRAARSAGSRSRTWRATATASAPRRRAACPRRSSRPRPARSTGCSPAGRGATGRSSGPSRRGAGACRSASSRTRSARLAGRGHDRPRRVPARRLGARVVRPGGPADAPAAVARQAAARGRAGRGRDARALPARVAGRAPGRRRRRRRCAAARRWSGSPRSSTSSRACRFPLPCWSATSCRRGSRATSRASSTSWARWARSPGSGTAAWVATTAASCSTGRAASCCSPVGPDRMARPGRSRSSTTPSGSTSRRAARRSSGRSRPARPAPPRTEREVLDALWDLVWAGEVTNDTFAPLRALRWKRPAARTSARGRVGRLTSLGPPEAAGRWSLVGSGLWDAAGPPLEPDRAAPSARARAARPARGARPRVGDGRGPRGRLLRGLPDAPRPRGGGPDPARLLRRRARRRAVRARRRPRAAARRPRAGERDR